MSMSSQTVQFQNCAVCGRGTDCCHFGALSCKACAAFFRRIVAKKKVYFCERRGNCPVNARRNPKICPACRWRRCIAVGMQQSAVLAAPPQTQPQRQNTPEQQQLQQRSPTANAYDPAMMLTLQKFDYSANFSSHQNHEWLRNLLLVNRNVQHERMTILTPDTFNKKTQIPEISKYMLNDFQFCKMYLDSVGILDIAKNVIEENIAQIMYYWCHVAAIFNSIRSDSITVGKLVNVDHSVIEITEASLREMYATEPLFSIHLDTVVTTSLPMWYRAEEMYNRIYALGLTNAEQAFLLLLGMIEIIISLSSEPKVTRLSFKPIYDNVFRSMHMYYRDNYSVYFGAVRMGELILTLSLINEGFQSLNEHRTIMKVFLGFPSKGTQHNSVMEEPDTSSSISPTTVTVYSVIYYALTVINLIVTPIYMYVVIFKSKDTMKSFKNLLIAGMPFLIYSTTFISITIPIYEHKVCNYQFYGVIKDVSLTTIVTMTTALDICDQVNGDLLLIMLINRYQIVSADFIEHSKFLYPAIYAFLAVTNMLQNAIIIIKLVLEPMFPSLSDSFVTNVNFFVITIGLILLSRIYAHLKVAFLNRSFARKVQPVITPATLQLHTMLFRAVLSNIFVTIVSKLLYMTLVIGTLIDQSSLDILINMVTMFHNVSYICEMIITLYFVKPYRDFIASFFRRRVEAPIAVFSSNIFQTSFH